MCILGARNELPMTITRSRLSLNPPILAALGAAAVRRQTLVRAMIEATLPRPSEKVNVFLQQLGSPTWCATYQETKHAISTRPIPYQVLQELLYVLPTIHHLARPTPKMSGCAGHDMHSVHSSQLIPRNVGRVTVPLHLADRFHQLRGAGATKIQLTDECT